jgi:phosphoglycerate kinase
VSAFQTLDDLTVTNKKVLVRVDLNVPLNNGVVGDATRIKKVLPTITELSDKGAKVILLAHLGRPTGKDASLSLKPIADSIQEILPNKNVTFAADCIGEAAQQAVDSLQQGDILLLENVRFYPQEEKNDSNFTKQLAALGDLYVNDAFSAAHRAHSSTAGLATVLPCAAGRLMQAELDALERALTTPERPVMAIVGGAKISTKLDLLHNLVSKVNILAIGGGMANTFLYAQGVNVGKSLCEKEAGDTARAILQEAAAKGCKILLPTDVVAAEGFAANSPAAVYDLASVPDTRMILDMGDASIAAWCSALEAAKTVVWNGPVGAFELEPFDKGTLALAAKIVALTKAGKIVSVAGGGDTIAALVKADSLDKLSYVSTAGGAFLEWLEGKELPGVAALVGDKI